jgi:hypothetical protein
MQTILFPVSPDDLIPSGFLVHKVVLGRVLLTVLHFNIGMNPSALHASASLKYITNKKLSQGCSL